MKKNTLLSFSTDFDTKKPEILEQLIAHLRPRNIKNCQDEVIYNLHTLSKMLQNNTEFRKKLQETIRNVFSFQDPLYVYTEIGMLSNKGFFTDLVDKIKNRMLPPVTDNFELSALLDRVFHKKDDYVWIHSIDDSYWLELFDALDFYYPHCALGCNKTTGRLLISIEILSHRIASLGLDYELTHKLTTFDINASPFIIQNRKIDNYFANFLEKDCEHENQLEKIEPILEELESCEAIIDYLRKNKHRYGVSLRMTYLTLRLQQFIDRTKTLLILLHPHHNKEFNKQLLQLFKELIQAENQKNNVWKHIVKHFDLLAYEITEHAAKTGRHYIAENRKQYIEFLKSSIGGGLLVAFFALFKILLSYMSLSPFGEAFMYSINYALCFVFIYLAGFTLATKQPAMTASAIAKTLDIKNSDKSALLRLKETLIKLHRTQFISFVGNLLMAFPVAFLLAHVFSAITGTYLVEGEKANYLINGIHPWHSPALLFAAIAGFFLSISGFISGYFDNKVVYNQIPRRLRQSEGLKRLFGKQKLEKLSRYIENNLGALAGNTFLGFFLGSTATIGFIFGIPLDIRHIAFSSSNLAYSFVGQQYQIPLQLMIEASFGVLAIGFVNFLISFGLTIFVAMESRRISFRFKKSLIRSLLLHFIKRPWDFFLPMAFSKKRKK